tara:strand:- start:623 stop:808 length:186 start_codon:yes stop_codon:yes gene_type:complete
VKVGDLVKYKGDKKFYFGIGIIINTTTRMAEVLWNDHYAFKDAEEDEWLWKTSLEIISEGF